MQIFDIAAKDILQVLRDRKVIIFLVLMPIAFTLFFGFVLNGISDARLPVGWINADGDTAITVKLAGKLDGSEVIKLVEMNVTDAEKAEHQVRNEKLSAALLVPEGFSQGVLSGEIVPLTLITLPDSAAGGTASTAVEAAINQLLSTVVIANLSAEAFEANQPFVNATARDDYLDEGVDMAAQAWENPSFSISYDSGRVEGAEAVVKNKGFHQASPGMIVQFAIMSMTTCSMVLYLERKSRTLERMMTTTVRRSEIIAGHVLGMFIVVFIQEMVLAAFGQIIFGVNYLREPLGVLLMMAALALWASCLGLLVSAISKTSEQVIMITIMTMILLSAIGGAWFPLEITGKTFSMVGHFTPAAWAMDGFQNIVLRGQGFVSTLLPAAMLTVFSLIFFMVAVWKFDPNSQKS